MSSAPMPAGPTGQAQVAPSCLLVEDQVLIGMSLEAFLVDCGWDVAGPLSSNGEAVSWLRQNKPDMAILDFSLRDGPCMPVARELRACGVPFLIYSGSRPDPALPPELREVPWLEKPTARDSLLRAIASVVPVAADRLGLPR